MLRKNKFKPFTCLGAEPEDLSGNDVVNGLHFFDADQFLIQTAVEERQTIRIQSHLMKYGGVQVFHMQGISPQLVIPVSSVVP